MSRNVSRRGLLEGLAIAASASAGMALSLRAEAQVQKVSQANAKYRPTPNGQQRCSICINFEPPNQCKIVQGPISPNGWCQFFAARENAH